MMESDKEVVHYLLHSKDAFERKRSEIDQWVFVNEHSGLYEQYGTRYWAYRISPTQQDLTYSCLDEEMSDISVEETLKKSVELLKEIRQYVAIVDYALMGKDSGAGWVRYLARDKKLEHYHIIMVFDHFLDAVTFKLSI